MTATAPKLGRTPAPAHDSIIVLQGCTWSDFQRMLEIRGERAVPRLAYSKGVLELMSPSRSHESIKSMLGRLVEVWCLDRGIDFSAFGSWTLESKELDRAIEPDECYVLGNETNPARPHLAIEVVWSSGGISKLPIYAELGVREVWIWQRGAIRIHVLREAAYVEAAQSETLPGIDLSELLKFVDVQPTSAAIRAYRDALRTR